MTTQTASRLPTPNAQYVAKEFVAQYYHILHRAPEMVFQFYQEMSTLSRPDPSGLMTTVTTMTGINDMICSLDYTNYKSEINTTDAQSSYKEGIIVLVTGYLTGKDTLRRKFTQTFFLAPHAKGYYVLNDVFRFVEDSESEDVAEVATIVDDTPSSTLTQDPDPARTTDPPKPESVTSHAEGTKPTDEKKNIQVTSEGPANRHRGIVGEPESHLIETHAPVAEELITSAPLEDTPKKSYASIVRSQTKKGPAKPFVPTNAVKVASAKTEKQPVNPVTESSISEASENHATVNALGSDDAQDKVEGHSIYICNLPVNITVAQLEAEFAKFGPIKHNGVQVSCTKAGHIQHGFSFGFVEFQELSSMQGAIKASPITIGGRKAIVEIKRTTARGGNWRDRGNFSGGYSWGGFRNENFRGRGNFSGGQSIRGRGNFRNWRGGESYQQGRGQGGGRPSPSM